MPNIVTAALDGLALAWAVAKAEGFDLTRYNKARNKWVGPSYTAGSWDPLNNDAQWGGIMRRECISVRFNHKQNNIFEAYIWTPTPHDLAEHDSMQFYSVGLSMAQAVLRCHVLQRLGPTLDVPQEFL